MPRYVPWLASLLLAGFAFPAAASAQTARVTTTLAMRAGPSTEFPAVSTIHSGEHVVIHGCVRGYSWCDVSADGDRGWVYAAYLTYPYHDNYVSILNYGDEIDLPLIVFSVDDYWGHYYRGRPWYHNRNHWRSVWRDRGHHEARDRDRDRNRRSVNRQSESRERVGREESRGRVERENRNRGRSMTGQREERRGRTESRSRIGSESPSRNLGRSFEGRSGGDRGSFGRSSGPSMQGGGNRGGDRDGGRNR